MPRGKSQQPLLLKDLIRQIRRELTDAVEEREAVNEPPLFSLDTLDLEVNFVVEQEESVEGTASAKLFAIVGLKAGAKHTYSREQIQKVTLHLSPIKRAGTSEGTHQSTLIEAQSGDDEPVIDVLRAKNRIPPGWGTLVFDTVRIKDFPGAGKDGISITQLLEGVEHFTKETGSDKLSSLSCRQLIRRTGPKHR